MPKKLLIIISAITAVMVNIPAAAPVLAQENQAADPLQYADLADLSADAPVIIRATVKKTIKVDPERAPNAPAGTERLYVVAQTTALIRGQGGAPETIRYLIDVPVVGNGRAAKLKKKDLILFGRSLSNSTGDLQLVANNAQIEWTPSRDARVRAIVKELVMQNAAPAITGIASAFHVPGTIIGEGETQIFMETETRQPVSITILQRDGQKKIWAVSLSEIVDEAARAPVRNTLLWYRLACFLPKELPEEALRGDSQSNINQARLDYRMVIQDLGNCPRSRAPLQR